MEYSFLNDLNNTHDNWRIRARICRMWVSTNPQKNGELISIDMILIDEKDTLMHATIRKHLASRFKHLLQEGSLYSIRNLKIMPATGSYRPLSCELKALFLATTTLQRLEEGVVNISLHGFQFVLPDIIETRLNDKTILSDVVGYLTGIGGIDIVGNSWKKRDLEIVTNHSVTATITLWGKMSEQFDPTLYKQDDGPYILIVTSTTIEKFKGALSFSSTNNSKIYMNLDIPYVNSMRERFTQQPKSLKLIESSEVKKLTLEEKMFFNRMSVKELVEAKWSEKLKEHVVTVRGKITGINNDFDWYYLSCKSCPKKVVAEDGVYMCPICKKNVDYPLMMFKVHVYIKDKTGTTTLALFNNVVEPLIDTSAKKLVDRLSYADNNVPEEFKTLLGKDLIYKLRLNSYNLKEGYANYSVSEVYEPKENLEHEYESKKRTAQEHNSLEDYHVKDHPRDHKRRKSMVVDDEEDEIAGHSLDRELTPDGTSRDKKQRKVLLMDDEEE